MKEIDLIIKLKILCYLNNINYLSWFDKRKKNVDTTNHEHLFFFIVCIRSRSNFFRKIHRFIAFLDASRWISLAGPLEEINVSVWTYLSTVIDLTIRIVCDERWRFNHSFSHWVPVCHSVNTAVRCKCFTTGGTSFLLCLGKNGHPHQPKQSDSGQKILKIMNEFVLQIKIKYSMILVKNSILSVQNVSQYSWVCRKDIKTHIVKVLTASA